jgi:hypothetical protein
MTNNFTDFFKNQIKNQGLVPLDSEPEMTGKEVVITRPLPLHRTTATIDVITELPENENE